MKSIQIEHQDFEITIVDDNFYVKSTLPDRPQYQFQYTEGAIFTGRSYAMNKRGILVKDAQSKELLASTILCENGGRTTISHDLCSITGEHLVVLIGDKRYSLKLPNLAINWFEQGLLGAYFSIHHFKDDFLLFGEVGLSRMDANGRVIWKFKGGSGVFTPGKDRLKIMGDTIELIDGNDVRYLINEDGEAITQ